MSLSARLSDFEDNLLPNDNDDANDSDGGGYGSDEAVEDANFRDDDGKTDESKKRRIDPESSQKRTIRNPQPRLNAELLKGPKGIHMVEKQFEDFKFRGKGYEKSDLNRMMKKLEYWSHRLFPKFQFDDCLTKLETLGTKKPVQTHLTKIRLGMITDDVVLLRDAGEEQEYEERVEDSVPIDEFDALIAEELEKNRATVTPQQQNISIFSNDSDEITKIQPRSSHIEITAEMEEKIERNRQMAIQKRLARVEAEAGKKALQEQGGCEMQVDQENAVNTA